MERSLIKISSTSRGVTIPKPYLEYLEDPVKVNIEMKEIDGKKCLVLSKTE